MRPLLCPSPLAVLILSALLPTASAQDEFELPPIEYSKGTPDDCIADLQGKLDRGELRLNFDPKFGYLPDLLKSLEVPVESQTLVFSKTSLQRSRISPKTPRAIYFGDDVYVGYCQKGSVLEISAVDPNLGTVFYSLDQKPAESPTFVRQTDSCLLCHSSSRTGGIPGHLVRSMRVDYRGDPIFSSGSYTVDHTTPLERRWGGWYVTGEHGSQKHMGNVTHRETSPGRTGSEGVRTPVGGEERGQNVTSLEDRFDTSKYLVPHSDIAALMVLEHQVLVHNTLTKAGFAVRRALHDEAILRRSVPNPTGEYLDSTTRRIQGAAEDVVKVLLMCDEADLTDPLVGTSGFAEVFAEPGPRDREGRSLRELDLRRRLFRYPCSYLIHSPAFDGMPSELYDAVQGRLLEVLDGADRLTTYGHLSYRDRQAILENLRDTKPEFFLSAEGQ